MSLSETPNLVPCRQKRRWSVVVCFWLSLALVSPFAGAAETSPGGPTGPRGTLDGLPSWVENKGYEHIIAGPNVDADFGLVTTPGYVVNDVAISGDGLRIWFVLLDRGGSPEYEIWSIGSDGSSPLKSEYGPGVLFPSTAFNLFVDTDVDGDVAILDSGPRFSRASPGNDLVPLFELDSPFGQSDGQKRVANHGQRFLFLDRWNDTVWSVDMSDSPITTSPIAPPALLQNMGRLPRTTAGFDMSASGELWFTAAENFFGDVGRNRYWIARGYGFLPDPAPVIELQALPYDDRPLAPVEVTDDGGTMVYCPTLSLGEYGVCFVQDVGTALRFEITEGGRRFAEPVLSNLGLRVYLRSTDPVAPAYGFFEFLNRHARRVAGTQRFSATALPEFPGAELNAHGDILTAPSPFGVYVLHDDADIPPDFPKLSEINYGIEGDELVVRVLLYAPNGVERIFNLPLYRGMEPTRSIPNEENPLWQERNGGGVNLSTTYDPVGGDVWERRIPLDGKGDFLTADYSLRIVVVDHTGHRSSYYDVRFGVSFADDFESGALSTWTRVVGAN